MFEKFFGKTKPPKQVDPNEILFSLATICEALPNVDALPPEPGSRWMHEDDWRQIEFLPQANRPAIEAELSYLLAFKQQHWRGAGWNQMHLRKEPNTPLASLGINASSFSGLPLSPLQLGNGRVSKGFATTDSTEWFLYGQHDGASHVLQLGVAIGAGAPAAGFAALLCRLAQENSLLLVDWYSCAIIATATPEPVATWIANRRRP